MTPPEHLPKAPKSPWERRDAVAAAAVVVVVVVARVTTIRRWGERIHFDERGFAAERAFGDNNDCVIAMI